MESIIFLEKMALNGDVSLCDINGDVESHRLIFNNLILSTLNLFLTYTYWNY